MLKKNELYYFFASLFSGTIFFSYVIFVDDFGGVKDLFMVPAFVFSVVCAVVCLFGCNKENDRDK